MTGDIDEVPRRGDPASYLDAAGDLAAHAAEAGAILADLEGVELPPGVADRLDALVARLEEAGAELELKMMASPRLAVVRRVKATVRAALDAGMPADEVRARLRAIAEEALAGPDDAAFRGPLGRIVDDLLAGGEG